MIALIILLTPFLNTLQLLKAKYAAPILPGQQTYIYVNVPSQYARNFCVSILAFVYFCISVFAQKCHSQACTRPVPDQSVQTNKATMTKIFKPATINIFLLQQQHKTSKTNSSVKQLPNKRTLLASNPNSSNNGLTRPEEVVEQMINGARRRTGTRTNTEHMTHTSLKQANTEHILTRT